MVTRQAFSSCEGLKSTDKTFMKSCYCLFSMVQKNQKKKKKRNLDELLFRGTNKVNKYESVTKITLCLEFEF